MSYCGRFAPSPTGPLHSGSLVAALASFIDARQQQGRWLVRIEDLDPLRESLAARDQILASLEAHGLHWDGGVLHQSHRHVAYDAVLNRLREKFLLYPCPCSRKELIANQGYHPRHCRQQPQWHTEGPVALRFSLDGQTEHWDDRLLGPQSFTLAAEKDDPVLRRKEGFYAYHLAVVCDDLDQGVTDVVRGQDLLSSTPVHLSLYRALGAAPPRYLHLPLVRNAGGQKLSKQNHAPALDDSRASHNLWTALSWLGQAPTADLQRAPVTEILGWAQEHWRKEPLREIAQQEEH